MSSAALCSRCQSLTFDDEKLGGKIDTCHDGVSVLCFTKSIHQCPLPWEYRDILPHLPQLEKSAGDGCKFCGFLWGAIIRAEIAPGSDSDVEIIIRLRYEWLEYYEFSSSPRKEHFSLVAAISRDNHQHRNDEERVRIHFLIGSDDGEPAYNRPFRISSSILLRIIMSVAPSKRYPKV